MKTTISVIAINDRFKCCKSRKIKKIATIDRDKTVRDVVSNPNDLEETSSYWFDKRDIEIRKFGSNDIRDCLFADWNPRFGGARG